MSLYRRQFLRHAGAAALAFAGLRNVPSLAQVYALDPKRGINKAGQLYADPAGIINLPADFNYKIVSSTGDTMSDGLITPSAPDGMAAFPVAGNPEQCVLVRNHELDSIGEEVDPFNGDKQRALRFVGKKSFDYHKLGLPLNGGTTTLRYDYRTQRIEQSHLSLIGTARNCAGGATPWGSWLSCEESLGGKKQGFGRDHGYVFEVPSTAKGLVDPVPLKDMGRFLHEAAAVDSSNGIVYLTEDFDHSILYRFIPKQPGKLAAGGKLQALVIQGWPSALTRNWVEDHGNKNAQTVHRGQQFRCQWIDLNNVHSPDGDLSLRGATAGAARFCRCEGIAFAIGKNGQRDIYFAATGGGPKHIGQLWRYQPSVYEGTTREKELPGTLELVYETHNRAIMESCDNLAVAPWGDLIICEDSYSNSPDMVNYIRALTPDGRLYTLAMNAHPQKGEFCGACFSPNGKVLFVNIQRPGMTLAITGPWERLRTATQT